MKASRGLSLCLFLSLIGMGLAGYLTYMHFGFLRGELLGGFGCGAAGSLLNCHAVTAGSWGQFLGMPLALWGLLGYVTVFGLSLWGRQSQETAGAAAVLLALLSLFMVAADLYLLGVMVFVIRFYCLFCLLTSAVNLSLLVVSSRSTGVSLPQAVARAGWVAAMLLPSPRHPAADLFWGLLFVGVLGVMGLHVSTVFVSRGTLANARQQIKSFLIRQPRVAVESSGDPSTGPADAPLKLVEFSDFLCPACQRASKVNTIILANHRHDANFTFKNYPLDNTCNEYVSRAVHPGACQVAAAGECAYRQGKEKFWSFHDLVFEKGHDYPLDNINGDMERIGVDLAAFRACMDGGQGMEAVKRDIAEGKKLGIQSTPTYVINGVPMAGGLNPVLFDDLAASLKASAQ